ncbi:MAG: hypothetical protein U0869_21715 [Chloroflexota bacterium]
MPAVLIRMPEQAAALAAGTPAAAADVRVEDLRLYGQDLAAEVAGAVTDGRLDPTIEGAPSLTVTLHDPGRRLLRANRFANQKLDVRFDRAWWRLVGVDKQGDALELTFVDRIVAWMQQYSNPRKAYRDQVTRAEFAVSLIDEVSEGEIRVVCPALHKVQPIAGAAGGGGPAAGGTLGPGALKWTLQGKASVFDDHETASGIPADTHAGIATKHYDKIGGWWVVVAPNGRAHAEQQIDNGPNAAIDRVVDLSRKAASEDFGYPGGESAFPTDRGTWKLYYCGKGEAAKRSAQSLAAGQAAGRGPSSRQARQAQAAGDAVRAPGLADGARVTVKGEPADAEQRRNITTILTVGSSQEFNAPRPVLIAAIMTATQESVIRNTRGGDRDSAGVFQQRPSQGWGTYAQVTDVAHAAGKFFGPAVKAYRADPRISLNDLCQHVQKSGTPNAYGQWESEATRTVDAFTGGAAQSFTGTGAHAQSRTRRYAFQRGQNGKRENTWDCLGRLMDEVGWRRFAVRNTLYLISEEDLFASRPRLTVSEALPWVDSIDGSILMGRKRPAKRDDARNPSVGELTVICRADRWIAPPGSTVEVEEMGPFDGRWLVAGTPRGLFSRDASIALRKPIAALPEPAPETEQIISRGAPAGTDQAGSGAGHLVEWLKTQVGYTEGPGNQNKYGPSTAWCGYFVQYALGKIAGLPISSDMGWVPHIRDMIAAKAAPFAGEVSAGAMQPGDVITWSGHTGFYIGGGQAISGNYSDGVRQHGSTAPGAIVKAGRPAWKS